MIVEFIGASGSGKTTLARGVAQHLAAVEDCTTASDLVLDRWKLKRISHSTMQNVIADIGSFVDLPRLSSDERAFLRYAFRRLSLHRPIGLQTLNYYRSVVRRTGMNSYAHRVGSGRIVLADEGLVLVAYLLFAYGGASFDDRDLAKFASVVPLPDRIVHVKAPVELLIERAISRADRRRELTVSDRRVLQDRLARAADLFDRLALVPSIHNRVISVENHDCPASMPDETFAYIADGLRDPLHKNEVFDVQKPNEDLTKGSD